ncbi:MAG: hypothetical protein ACRDZ5_03895, partial [Acidimicrobiales bacterium]
MAATLSSCSPARGSLPSPSGAITQYLTAWSHGNWGATARLVVVGKRVAVVRDSQAVFSELGVRHVAIAHGTVLDQGTRASVPVTWTVKLAGLGDLSVHSIVHLRLRARHWKVVFSPATIDPHLRQGSHFVVSTLWAPRAPVLADNGSVLSSEQPGGVEIGVQGSFIKDPAYLEASLLRAGAT